MDIKSKVSIFLFILSVFKFCSISSTSTPEVLMTTSPQEWVEIDEEEDEEIDVGIVHTTEEVMDANIKIKDIPDIDEDEMTGKFDDPTWDKKKIIKDVAYFIRAHKFHDYDRRYFERMEDSPTQLFEAFPDPPLRALHWEVRRHCNVNFLECLRYLEETIEHLALKREDDTVSVMLRENWTVSNEPEQVRIAQVKCQDAQKKHNRTMIPFQGVIERFQWRTTVSYYMCWYTMLGNPDLAFFNDSCDHHANCLDEFGVHNRDPRANDSIPYSCALYSFCPDHCCPMKHIWSMKDCFESPLNPCYSENGPDHQNCSLKREENRDLQSLILNHINVSCECPEPGNEWSSKFGICVDVDECIRQTDNCNKSNGESCFNLPGRFECICVFGYVYDPSLRRCVYSETVDKAVQQIRPSRANGQFGDDGVTVFVVLSLVTFFM